MYFELKPGYNVAICCIVEVIIKMHNPNCIIFISVYKKSQLVLEHIEQLYLYLCIKKSIGSRTL